MDINMGRGTMEFAPNHPRNSEGWIVLPDDVSWRKSIFPQGVMSHLAKLQMYLEEAIYHYVSKPGDTLLDPMGGTGTLMMAALEGRTVITLDIEKGYHELQKEVYSHLRARHPDMSPCIQLHGNCKLLLPIPCHHIIFSPPYGQAFKPAKKITKFVEDKYRVDEEEYLAYAQTTGNVGLHNTFLYNQDMEKVYKLCYQSIRSGGTMSVVTKDIIEGGKRIYLTKWIQRVCKQIGFVQQDWFKTKMMGGPWQDIRRSRDEFTIDDEDTLIFRRP